MLGWMQLYTEMLLYPAMFGTFMLVVQLIGAISGDASMISPNSNRLTPAFAGFLTIWTIVFLEKWKRRQNVLKFRWGTDTYVSKEVIRENFVGPLNRIKDHTGKVLIAQKEYGAYLPRIAKWMLAVSVMLIVVAGFVAVTAVSIWMRARSNTVCVLERGEWESLYGEGLKNGSFNPADLSTDCDEHWYLYLGSLFVNAMAVSVFGAVFHGKLAPWLTELCNWRTDQEHKDAHVVKSFVFEALAQVSTAGRH